MIVFQFLFMNILNKQYILDLIMVVIPILE